jgi:HTH-type transcriptional regulator/antitoxin MqsA
MSEKKLICPECEEGELAPATREIVFTHKERDLAILDLECYRCAACGVETVKPPQIRRNQARIADAKRRADGYLTGVEIRDLRESLRLSQPEAAQLFGGGANAFSKYERGEVIQSASMDKLLRLVATHPWMIASLYVQAGLQPPGSATGTYVDTRAVCLNSASYRSRQLHGTEIVASPQKRESSVVSIADWGQKKVA